MEHLQSEQLLDLLENRVNAEERQRVQQHLADCSICSAELKSLSAMMDVLSQQVGHDAPEHLLDKAVMAFRTVAPSKPSITSRLASLMFDSWQQTPTAHMRGTQQTRQLLMSEGDRHLYLSIDYSVPLPQIRGQVTDETAGENAVFDAALHSDGTQETNSIRSDESGEFILQGPLSDGSTIVLTFDDGSQISFVLPLENTR